MLGIIKYNNKILIVRRENDPLVKELEWCLPGGSLEPGINVEECLKMKIKKKVGLDISFTKLLFARVPEENNKFLLMYYYCESEGNKFKLQTEFVDAKWIKPAEYSQYFTTSIDQNLKNFLEKSLYFTED